MSQEIICPHLHECGECRKHLLHLIGVFLRYADNNINFLHQLGVDTEVHALRLDELAEKLESLLALETQENGK